MLRWSEKRQLREGEIRNRHDSVVSSSMRCCIQAVTIILGKFAHADQCMSDGLPARIVLYPVSTRKYQTYGSTGDHFPCGEGEFLGTIPKSSEEALSQPQ